MTPRESPSLYYDRLAAHEHSCCQPQNHRHPPAPFWPPSCAPGSLSAASHILTSPTVPSPSTTSQGRPRPRAEDGSKSRSSPGGGGAAAERPTPPRGAGPRGKMPITNPGLPPPGSGTLGVYSSTFQSLSFPLRKMRSPSECHLLRGPAHPTPCLQAKILGNPLSQHYCQLANLSQP